MKENEIYVEYDGISTVCENIRAIPVEKDAMLEELQKAKRDLEGRIAYLIEQFTEKYRFKVDRIDLQYLDVNQMGFPRKEIFVSVGIKISL